MKKYAGNKKKKIESHKKKESENYENLSRLNDIMISRIIDPLYDIYDPLLNDLKTLSKNKKRSSKRRYGK